MHIYLKRGVHFLATPDVGDLESCLTLHPTVLHVVTYRHLVPGQGSSLISSE